MCCRHDVVHHVVVCRMFAEQLWQHAVFCLLRLELNSNLLLFFSFIIIFVVVVVVYPKQGEP